jgi:hypothetical protein
MILPANKDRFKLLTFALGTCLITILIFSLGVPVYPSFKTGLLIALLFVILIPSGPHLAEFGGFAINVNRALLALSVVSVAWVFIFSTDRVVFQLAVLFITGLCFITLRNTYSPSKHPAPLPLRLSGATSFSELLLVTNLALILRGWTHLIYVAVPVLIYLAAKSRVPTRWMGRSGCFVFPGFLGLVILAGAWASHTSVQPMSSQFWVSYDQVFRAAMATGLTRWGWSDSNFGTGHAFTYHWLPEAVGGVLARLSGVGEADVIARILPAIGMLFAATIVSEILRSFLLKKLTILTITLTFLTVEGSLELFSIGTLWGTSIFLTAIWLFVELITEDRLRSQILLFVVLPILSLLSQSALGLSLVLGFVIAIIFLVLSGTLAIRLALENLILLGMSTLLLQQTLFRKASVLSGSGVINLDGFLKFPALSIPLGRSPDSTPLQVHANSLLFVFLLVATYAIGFSFRPDSTRSRIWQLLIGAQLAASMILLNFFPLGSYSGKFLVPVGILGLLIGLIALGKLSESMSLMQLFVAALCIAFFVWFTRRLATQISTLESFAQNMISLLTVTLLFFCSMLAVFIGRTRLAQGRRGSLTKSMVAILFIGSCLFVWPRQALPQTIRQAVLSSPRDHSFFLEDKYVRSCLDFISANTPSDAVIATSMWRLPGLSDERYVLTSLLGRRRTLIDGPVFDHVNWPSRAYFEDLKNVHTSFANSLDDESHAQLVKLGASYFVLDTRHENTDRTWTSMVNQDVVFDSPRCSVIKL